ASPASPVVSALKLRRLDGEDRPAVAIPGKRIALADGAPYPLARSLHRHLPTDSLQHGAPVWIARFLRDGCHLDLHLAAWRSLLLSAQCAGRLLQALAGTQWMSRRQQFGGQGVVTVVQRGSIGRDNGLRSEVRRQIGAGARCGG